MSVEEAKNAKKPFLTKKEVEAKFLLRGVTLSMIREAMGTSKCEVSTLRLLFNVFEEAHERGWDVAKGSWADAVAFYQACFSVKLSDDEQEPREVLTVDFLKRCWGVVLQREDESGPTAVVVLADTRVGSGVAPEAPILGAMVLEGVPLGSAAKPTLPGGASTLAVIVPPGKFGSISAAEADAEYERVATQVAAQ